MAGVAVATRFYEAQPMARWFSATAWVTFGVVVAAALAVFAFLGLGRDRLQFADILPLLVPVGTGMGWCIWIQSRRLVTRLEDGILSLSGGPPGVVRLAFWRVLPLHVAMEDVKAARVATFHPGIDGGWGSRAGRAVVITLGNGDEILVGTERPEELLAALGAARTRPEPPPDAP